MKMCPSLPTALLSRCTSYMLGWKAASNPRGSGHLNSPHNTRKQQGSGAMLWNSNGLLKFKSDSDSGDSGGEAVEAALGLMQTPYRPTQITYSCSPGPATGMQSSTTNAHYITSNAVSLDNRMHGVNTTTLCIKHPYIPGQTSMHKHRL